MKCSPFWLGEAISLVSQETKTKELEGLPMSRVCKLWLQGRNMIERIGGKAL